MRVDEALRLLGLDASATIADVLAARRDLARSVHPDVGGRTDDMVRINRAVDVLISHIEKPIHEAAMSPSSVSSTDTHGARRWMIDRPSFVIDVLPVDAFEWLLLAARVLGEVVDDDPPYALEVLLDSRVDRWCRLEVVPDAGSSTVSIVAENVEPEELVALWVDTINELTMT